MISELYSEDDIYYSVVQDSKIIHERTDALPFVDSLILNGKEVTITTKGYGDEASIMIDDGEYCPEEESIDIVVIDKETGNVIDSAGLNIETGEMIKY